MGLGGAIAKLFVTLGMDKRGFDAGARSVQNEMRGLKDSLAGGAGSADLLGRAMKGIAWAGVAAGATQAARAMWDLGEAGAMALRTEASFDRLAGRIGESGESLLGTMREVSENTISDMSLMGTTSGLLASGIQTSSEEIALALDVAQLKAQQFGLTTQEAFERMVTGARKGSVEMLDELGIVVRAEGAYRRRAEALGVSVDALTDAQRAESLWKAILADGQRELETYGGAVEDYATSFEQAQVAVDNASIALKEVFAPAVASVAQGIADTLPQLVTTAEQLSILADAGIEWAAAALQGRDAELAFNAAVAEGVGDAGTAARLRYEAAQAALEEAQAQEENARILAGLPTTSQQAAEATLRMAAANIAAAEAAVELAREEWVATDATRNAGAAFSVAEEELVKLGGAATEASSSVGSLSARMEMSARDAQRYAGVLADTAHAINEVQRDLAAVDMGEISSGFAGSMGRVESTLLGVAGVADTATLNALYGRYQDELAALYEGTSNMTDFELAQREAMILGHLDSEVDAFRTAATEERRVLGDMNDTYSELRGIVQSALRPTSVTAEDMGLAAMGQYVDAWDENARRLDAVAARGFEELKAHPDWAAMLEIPPAVLASGEEALKAWANRTADSVRNLERPDLINIDAAIAAVQAELNRQAAVELSLDIVTKAAVDAGLVTGEDAKSQVAQALGLETELPVSLVPTATAREDLLASLGMAEGAGLPLPVTFEAAEQATATAATAGGSMAAELMAGVTLSIKESQVCLTFIQRMNEDVKAQQEGLSKAGVNLWKATEVGILGAMQETNYGLEFAAVLAPIVATWLKDHGRWSGTGIE
jgi:hypothetical protein